MNSSSSRRISLLSSCMITAALGFAVPATAASPSDEVVQIPFPAGSACDFDLLVELRGGNQQHTKEFFDKNGNVVRSIHAGKGSALTFINESNGNHASR